MDYKGLIFCRNSGLIEIMYDHVLGTHSTEISAEESSKNYLHKPKNLGFL